MSQIEFLLYGTKGTKQFIKEIAITVNVAEFVFTMSFVQINYINFPVEFRNPSKNTALQQAQVRIGNYYSEH